LSGVFCHVNLPSRGAVASSARLIDGRKAASWMFTRGDTESAARDSVTSLARWLKQQLAAAAVQADISICLDVDHAVCGWVTTAGVDDKSIKAAVRDAQNGEREDAGTATPANWLKVGDVDADLSVQPLAPPAETGRRGKAETAGTSGKGKGAVALSSSSVGARQRVAIVALPDLAARALADELDKLDVPVLRIATVWHLLAEAWDPSVRSADDVLAGQTSSTSVVAEQAAACSACILLDPRGRLLWSWQQQGRLLAAGSLRLAIRTPSTPMSSLAAAESGDDFTGSQSTPPAPAPAESLEVTSAEISRLTADWLGWAAQLGVAPSIITIVGPTDSGSVELASKLAGAGGAAAGHSSGIGGVGIAIGAAWPGCVVSVVAEDAPLDATLRRCLTLHASGRQRLGQGQSTERIDPRTALVELASRPGKASRMVYRWVALAVAAAAVVLVVMCVRFAIAAQGLARTVAQVQLERVQILKDLVPIAPKIETQANKSGYLTQLRIEREKQRDAIVPEKPLVPETARLLSAIAQIPNVTLKRLNAASATAIRADLTVPDATTGRLILEKIEASPPSTPEYAVFTGTESSVGGIFSFTANSTWAGKPNPNMVPPVRESELAAGDDGAPLPPPPAPAAVAGEPTAVSAADKGAAALQAAGKLRPKPNDTRLTPPARPVAGAGGEGAKPAPAKNDDRAGPPSVIKNGGPRERTGPKSQPTPLGAQPGAGDEGSAPGDPDGGTMTPAHTAPNSGDDGKPGGMKPGAQPQGQPGNQPN